jgi:hypothetical protein
MPEVSSDSELTRRLMQCVQEWGRTQGMESGRRGRETIDALLKTVTALRVFAELGAEGMKGDEARKAFRIVEKDGPLDAGEDAFLRLRARKEVLLEKLRKAVESF